jgi:D-alanyl-D-alanine carboxypeptidase
MSRRLLVGAIIAVIALSACSQSTPPASGARTPTTPGSATSTSVERPKVRIAQSALVAIANRYRSSCRSPGAAVGLRTVDGANHFAVSGRLAPTVALDRESQFLAGSVTKLFVATVAYQLIAAHELVSDATVDEYLRDWPRGNRITIAMLLGHRSGMGDFGNDFGKQLTELVLHDLDRVFSYDEVLDLVRAVPPVAQPGTTYHYSNANYIVLGAILERITHATLGQLLDTRIIKPLRLAHTLYGPDDLEAAGKVTFHGLFDVAGTGHPIDIGTFPRASALTVDPAGAGLFSSLPDLLTFVHALFATDALLSPTLRADLASTVSTLTATDLLLDKRFVIEGHGGASPGAQTIVAYDSAHATTVAVWCNRLDPGTNELLPSVIAARELMQLAAPAPRP